MSVTASWYHCSVKVISRSSGRTAVAAAAYRSGELLHDNQLQKTYDYTRRRGIETSFVVVPENAPDWAYNLQELWNRAQEKDNRKNSCLAREVELALPNSLKPGEREILARDFANHLVDRYGVAVSVALHEPSRHGDDRNYHAHILFTTRRVDENGFGAKTRELDDKATGSGEIKHIREFAGNLINAYLEEVDLDERVDHRSFKDRGIRQQPQKHLGVEACAMERRGEVSELGSLNQKIREDNRILEECLIELAAIDAEIAAEMEKEFLIETEPEPIAELTWEEQPSMVPASRRRVEAAEFLKVITIDSDVAATQSEFREPVLKPKVKPDQTHEAVPWEEQPSMVPASRRRVEAAEFLKVITVDSDAAAAQSEFREPVLKPKVKPDQLKEALTWEKERTAILDSLHRTASDFEEAIREYGEVREFDYGKSRFGRAVTIFKSLYNDTVDYIKTSFNKYFGRSQPPAQEREDYENDPDVER